MKIAVLGTGNVGRLIAQKINESGHEVTIGTRNVKSTKETPGNPLIGEWLENHRDIPLLNFEQAASGAELVVNATSGMHSLDALKQAGEANLKDKVLIDIANPLDFTNGMPPSLNPVNIDSLGEQIQRTFPKARVVKTLNTMYAGIMVNPSLVQGDHNVFMSGNDAGAKSETSALLQSFGWKPENIIDLGDITTARGSEMMLPVWLRLWGALGTAEFNFYIRRNA